MADDTFPATLSRAISAKGVTLTWLSRRLRARGHSVSVGALSYWRSGARQPERAPSLDALPDLEELLGLPRGALTQRLGAARRGVPGPTSYAEALEEVPRGDSVSRVIEQFGLDRLELVEAAMTMTVDVNAAGELTTARADTVLRARTDNAQRYVTGWLLDEGEDQQLPEVTLIGGGVTGQRVNDPELGVNLIEVLAERPLRIGEEMPVELQMIFQPHTTDRVSAVTVPTRVREAAVWVRFEASKLPRRAWQTLEVHGEMSEVEIDVSGLRSIHHRARNFGPGSAGLRWEW